MFKRTQRRVSERINVETTMAVLQVPGRDPIKARVRDLSLGGIAPRCELPVALRTEVSVELPDAGGALIGTVSRSGNSGLAIEFRAGEITRSRVGRAMQVLNGAPRAA